MRALLCVCALACLVTAGCDGAKKASANYEARAAAAVAIGNAAVADQPAPVVVKPVTVVAPPSVPAPLLLQLTPAVYYPNRETTTTPATTTALAYSSGGACANGSCSRGSGPIRNALGACGAGREHRLFGAIRERRPMRRLAGRLFHGRCGAGGCG